MMRADRKIEYMHARDGVDWIVLQLCNGAIYLPPPSLCWDLSAD